MHIGILTLPLNSNYGGILQAYALSKHLQSCGHTTRLISRRKNHGSWLKNTLVRTKWSAVSTLYKTNLLRTMLLVSVEQFKQRYLSYATRPVFTTEELVSLCKREDFELIIVGSDQTWNKTAAPDLLNNYLDFCNKIPSVDRAAYACSFAKDAWDYSEEETRHCRALLKDFKGISVRERSACDLVKEHFGVDSLLHVDPTLLLDRAHYQSIAAAVPHRKFCFNYILDRSPEKLSLRDEVSHSLGLNSVSIGDPILTSRTVETWLGLFASCDFVFTDSYHGVVFAIIFRKPFLVVRNDSRGGARFNSILGQLGLLSRMVSPHLSEYEAILRDEIDWSSVESKLEPWIEDSKVYLQSLAVRHGNG